MEKKKRIGRGRKRAGVKAGTKGENGGDEAELCDRMNLQHIYISFHFTAVIHLFSQEGIKVQNGERK